jgi:hypothetical protein
MPWLDRPASVYVRQEVTLHRLDEPMYLNAADPVSQNITLYEVWEVRITYAFDAQAATWGVASLVPAGYRKGARSSVRTEIRATSPELRDLAQRYCPDWIPDPSKPKLELPADDVWTEALDAAATAVENHSTTSRGHAERLRAIITGLTSPYA